jgi:predicted deacylase
MNRELPGNENGVTAVSRHAWLLSNRLLRPNADVAIDFHTGTTGFDVTAFNLGSMDVPEIKVLLELYPVGQIFDNHVYPGVLHNAFVDVGIPAFTPEIGAARVLNFEMIPLFVEGTMNVLKHQGIVAGPMAHTGKDVSVFVGNSAFPIMATKGGLVEHLVKLRQGRGRTKGGHPAQQLRPSGCGVYEQCGWRGDGAAQRSNVRARQPPDVYPFQQGDAGGR